MGATKIDWCDAVWNPVRGCSQASPGCANCYAMRMAHRFSGAGKPYEGLTRVTEHGPQWTDRARFAPEMLELPIRWRKSRRIFVNSMGDMFHEDITDDEIAAIYGVMAACPQHTFIVLTKRPERMPKWFAWVSARAQAAERAEDWIVQNAAYARVEGFPLHKIKGTLKCYPWPLTNIWLGVSCENQAAADQRIPLLLQTPAAVRFVSAEPLLGPIDLSRYVHFGTLCECRSDADYRCDDIMVRCNAGLSRVNWVIAGCESGPGARRMDLAWVRSLRDQCDAAQVPFFFKQAMEDGQLVKMPLLDGQMWMMMPGGAK